MVGQEQIDRIDELLTGDFGYDSMSMAIFPAGDWVHPILGCGFLADELKNNSSSRIYELLDERNSLVRGLVSNIVELFLSNADFEKLQRVASADPYQTLFLSKFDRKSIEVSLQAMMDQLGHPGEMDVEHDYSRADGANCIVFRQVSSSYTCEFGKWSTEFADLWRKIGTKAGLKSNRSNEVVE